MIRITAVVMILGLALMLFGCSGVDEVTVREIARDEAVKAVNMYKKSFVPEKFGFGVPWEKEFSYAQGVKTNVLFFTRGYTDKDNTKEVWVFDLRVNMPSFGKRTPLLRVHFADFIKAFGNDPYGTYENLARREDGGEAGRFRKFSRLWIAERDDSLDISWLHDENNESNRGLPEPIDLVNEAYVELEGALEQLNLIIKELNCE